jgi:hypothetical protein
VALSASNWESYDEAEVVAVAQGADGVTTVLTLASALTHIHLAGVINDHGLKADMAAEVGLLSRNVVVEGAESTAANGRRVWRASTSAGTSTWPRLVSTAKICSRESPSWTVWSSGTWGSAGGPIAWIRGLLWHWT